MTPEFNPVAEYEWRLLPFAGGTGHLAHWALPVELVVITGRQLGRVGAGGAATPTLAIASPS